MTLSPSDPIRHAVPMTSTTSTTADQQPLSPGLWEFDRAHSQVGFTIRHLGISKLRGAFREVDAELLVGTSPADTSVRATIAMASMDTGLADRDERLLEPGLVDVGLRPELVFASTVIEPDGDGWTMGGDLRIGEVTAPVELVVAFGGIEEFALDGRLHAGFEARGRIKRSDYGIHFGPADPIVADAVALEMDLQFLAPAGGD